MNAPSPAPQNILGAPYTGTLPFPPLAEIKQRLGIPDADTSKDQQITSGMISTIALVESYLGRGVANVVDGVQAFEPIDTRDRKLFLSRFPVQSVTSVEVDGAAIASGSWRLFARQGVLELGVGCYCAPRHCEAAPLINVVYTAGYPDDAWPADLLEAVLRAFYGRWSYVSGNLANASLQGPVRSWTSDGLSVTYADPFTGTGPAYENDVIPPDLLNVAALLDPYRVRFVRGV